VNPYGECPSVVSSSKGTAVGSMPCAVNPKSARAPEVKASVVFVSFFLFFSFVRPPAPSHAGHARGSPRLATPAPSAARTSFGSTPLIHVGWSAPSHFGHVPVRDAPATNAVRGFSGFAAADAFDAFFVRKSPSSPGPRDDTRVCREVVNARARARAARGALAAPPRS
jgi:hypothetical protein